MRHVVDGIAVVLFVTLIGSASLASATWTGWVRVSELVQNWSGDPSSQTDVAMVKVAGFTPCKGLFRMEPTLPHYDRVFSVLLAGVLANKPVSISYDATTCKLLGVGIAGANTP